MNATRKYFDLRTLIGILVFLVILIVIVDRLGLSETASRYIEGLWNASASRDQPHVVSGRGNAIEIIWTFLLAAVLGGVVPYTGRLSRYQFTVLQAHMILSVSAAMMMMIIGSELARAFGILGAAGIVRYRYRLVSPREGTSLIVALGVGLACGTQLYLLAITATLSVVLKIGRAHV